MNEKEKMDFYIAMCRCCLIAEAMKTCPLCRFQIGLKEQEKHFEGIPAALPVAGEVTLFAMSESS